jgi:hypothetical protein
LPKSPDDRGYRVGKTRERACSCQVHGDHSMHPSRTPRGPAFPTEPFGPITPQYISLSAHSWPANTPFCTKLFHAPHAQQAAITHPNGPRAHLPGLTARTLVITPRNNQIDDGVHTCGLASIDNFASHCLCLHQPLKLVPNSALNVAPCSPVSTPDQCMISDLLFCALSVPAL